MRIIRIKDVEIRRAGGGGGGDLKAHVQIRFKNKWKHLICTGTVL